MSRERKGAGRCQRRRQQRPRGTQDGLHPRGAHLRQGKAKQQRIKRHKEEKADRPHDGGHTLPRRVGRQQEKQRADQRKRPAAGVDLAEIARRRPQREQIPDQKQAQAPAAAAALRGKLDEAAALFSAQHRARRQKSRGHGGGDARPEPAGARQKPHRRDSKGAQRQRAELPRQNFILHPRPPPAKRPFRCAQAPPSHRPPSRFRRARSDRRSVPRPDAAPPS